MRRCYGRRKFARFQGTTLENQRLAPKIKRMYMYAKRITVLRKDATSNTCSGLCSMAWQLFAHLVREANATGLMQTG